MSNELFKAMRINPVAQTASLTGSSADALDDMKSMETQLTQLTSEMSLISDKVGSLFTAHALAETAVGEGAKSVASKFVANELYNAGTSAEDAVSSVTGMESEGSDVGLEAWDAITDTVKNLIAWLKKKWTAFKNILKDYWNRYFGALVRAKRKWSKTLAKAKKMDEGEYSSEEKNIEFSSSPDYAVVFNVKDEAKVAATASEHVTMAKKLTTVGTNLDNVLGKFELVSDDTSTALPADLVSVHTLAADLLHEVSGATAKDDTTASKHHDTQYTHLLALPGRKVLCLGEAASAEHKVTTTPTTPWSAAKADMEKVKVEVSNVDTTFKKLDNVKIDLFKISDVKDIAEAQITLCEKYIPLKESKQLNKLTASIDKLHNATKKMTGRMEKLEGDEKPLEKAKIEFVLAGMEAATRATITAAMKLTSNVTSYTNSQHTLCMQMLKQYSVTKAA